ncbi:unnamed protein product [Brachionus calyciflorus]|uniref:MULE transposase domain-containing protein n=1 Tax=Brachionus calyciflorus TaxID=104777 RepID=A0A814BPI8_9BILA|nr:unnamed protein product [Brachionus calyciflorus]
MSKLSKNLRTLKDFFLVKFLIDPIKFEPFDIEPEGNEMYTALINSTEFRVEFLYLGSKADFEELIDVAVAPLEGKEDFHESEENEDYDFVNSNGTTDSEKTFHAYTISICTNETKDDFHFIFSAPKKHLKDIFNYDFKPEVLIADGVEATTNGFMRTFGYESIDDFTRVMCWAHVYRAIEIKMKSIEESLRNQIRSDISSMQLSPSPAHFIFSFKLFQKKW